MLNVLFTQFKITNTQKYLIASLGSFFLVVFPFFNFDGSIVDPDFIHFYNISFDRYLEIIKEDLGLYRVIAFTFEYLVPKAVFFLPFKSYLVVVIYYFNCYVLSEKILALMGISEKRRLFVFIFSTNSFLILGTIFTWTRTQNEFLSIMISWAFVSMITRSSRFWIRGILVALWGFVSLLSYELHFPFLLILLVCLGFISWKIIIPIFLCIPIIFYSFFGTILAAKLPTNLFDIVFNIKNLSSYLEIKFSQIMFTLREVDLTNIIIPVLIVALLMSLNSAIFIKRSYEVTPKTAENVKILLFSPLMLLIFFCVSWPSSNETIQEFGKLNWNIVYIFGVNILVAFSVSSSSNVLNFLKMILLCSFLIISGTLVRILKDEYLLNNIDFINNSVFRNIVWFLF